MLVLGIDTSNQTGAIGLVDQSGLLGEINIQLARRHSERLLPELDLLFKETEKGLAEVEGIGVAVGPGSFTGIRIALSTVKAFQQVLKIPVVGLSTLEILTAGVPRKNEWIVPVLDARRERVYTALFQGWQQEISESRIWPDQAMPVRELLDGLASIDPEGTFCLVGDGVEAYQDSFNSSELDLVLLSGIESQVRGGIVARLASNYLLAGRKDEPADLLPRYLKKTQAEINWQSKHSCGEINGD